MLGKGEECVCASCGRRVDLSVIMRTVVGRWVVWDKETKMVVLTKRVLLV